MDHNTRDRVFLLIESVLCVLFVAVLCYGAINIYIEGASRKAADPSEDIYTLEKISKAAEPALPILCTGIVVTIAGAALGVQNSKANKPVKDTDLYDHRSSVTEQNANPLRIIILLLSIIFIAAGIANGSMNDVLVKAINVCTECIGLG